MKLVFCLALLVLVTLTVTLVDAEDPAEDGEVQIPNEHDQGAHSESEIVNVAKARHLFASLARVRRDESSEEQENDAEVTPIPEALRRAVDALVRFRRDAETSVQIIDKEVLPDNDSDDKDSTAEP